jgi:Kef-type K+ transport system membrane component KefB
MDVSQFFIGLLVILLSSKVLAEVFTYLHLPSVLGEVVAGILIGPSLLNVIHPDSIFYLLAEIGILLLLFEVGLQTDVGQLARVGLESSLVAVTGVVMPAALVYAVCFYMLSLSFAVSLFMAGTFVATSIGITVRVLHDLRMDRSRMAKVVLGAAVLDDVIGVIILAILYNFSQKGSIQWMSSLKILAFIALFLVVAPVLTKLMVPAITKMEEKSRTKGLLPVVSISIILALALVANLAGAPAILGAFAAGIALAHRFFLPFGPYGKDRKNRLTDKIESGMKPIIDLFVPIFFVIVGASINLTKIDFTSPTFWIAASALTAVSIAAKILSGAWAKGNLRTKLTTGIAMVPRGEVGLIFAEVGRRSGVFDDSFYAVAVFVVALTTLAGPLLLKGVAEPVSKEQ